MARHRVVDAVARSVVYPQFPNALAYRFMVAKISGLQPINPRDDPRHCRCVRKIIEPVLKGIHSVSGEVVENLIHIAIVTYKSRLVKYKSAWKEP